MPLCLTGYGGEDAGEGGEGWVGRESECVRGKRGAGCVGGERGRKGTGYAAEPVGCRGGGGDGDALEGVEEVEGMFGFGHCR